MAWPWIWRALQKAGRAIQRNPDSVWDAYNWAKNLLGAGMPAAAGLNPAPAARVIPVEPEAEMEDDGAWILWLAGGALLIVAGVAFAVYLGGGGGGGGGNGGDNGGGGNGK
ncbi:putative uncharacterized protein FLJ45840 [Triticum aestivum]|uniref:putative uncharacterized protein FLJ45840 n=1 Tax=Triticum aestivum TaxID=4565 RepID=UPI001D027B3F|nr:putative uncharacterized protein FLJ45840 [Triticum aestivum]XP_044336687.1 putative uncharacterized protein FLJ45840 [Triticum aestivum]XP_044336688.1 putative uncharacterized protein FLJ45840 [Triticum aestivum]